MVESLSRVEHEIEERRVDLPVWVAALLCLAGTTCTLILVPALGDLGVAVSINLSPLLEIGDIQIIHAFLPVASSVCGGHHTQETPPFFTVEGGQTKLLS